VRDEDIKGNSEFRDEDRRGNEKAIDYDTVTYRREEEESAAVRESSCWTEA
jgi:hypothetical protein